MNFLDIIIIGILIYALYDGFHKGLISEIFKIVAFIIAFTFSGKLGIFIATKTISYWENSFSVSLGKAISAIIAFLIIFIIVSMVGKIINKSANDTLLSMPNKIFGAIFGTVKGFFIVALIFALIRIVPIGDDFLRSNISKVDNVDENIAKTELVVSGIKRAMQSPDSLKIIASITDSLTNITKDSVNTDTTQIAKPSMGNDNGSRIGYVAYKVSRLLDPVVLNTKKAIFDIDELKLDSTQTKDSQNVFTNPMGYINKAKKSMNSLNKSTNNTEKKLDQNN